MSTNRRTADRRPRTADRPRAVGSRLRAAGRRPWAAIFLLAATAALVACGDTGERTDADTATEAEQAMITAMNPWVRMAIVPEGSEAPDAPPINSAAYLVLANPTDTAAALVAVETEVSDTVEIHSVTMDEGVMRMRAIDSIPVPAGGEAVLEQGGYHIMLIGLRGPLSEGDSVELRLRLSSGQIIDVTAPVLRSPPIGADGV